MARKTIAQKIELEGGKEIADDLKQLGEAGEKAFAQIQSAADKAGSPGANLGRAIQNLQKEMKKLGDASKQFQNSWRDLGRAASNFGSSLATVGKRVGILGAGMVAATAGVVAFAKSGTEAADAAGKQAQMLGLPIDAYGRLAWAAEQSGVSQQMLLSGMSRLSREIEKAGSGNDAAATKFNRLGISVRNANGELKPTEQILQEMAGAFQRMPDGAEKSALAMDLMGRSGAQLLPFLNNGAEGLRALGKEAEALGIVFTEEQFRMAEGMNDALNKLNTARKGVQNQIGLLFAPSITQAADAFTGMIVRNSAAIQDFASRTIAQAIPIVEDFINAVMGRDQDVRSAWILQARDAVVDFANEVRGAIEGIVIPAYNAFMGVMDAVAATFNTVFGTDFTGRQVAVALAIGNLLGVFGLLGSGINLVAAAFKTLFAAFGLLGPLLPVIKSFWGVLVAGAKLSLAPLLAIVGWPALIGAAIGIAAALIYIFWDDIVAAAERAWEYIKGLWPGLAETLEAVWSTIAAGATAAWEGIKAGISEAWEFIKAIFTSSPGQVWEGIVTAADSVWQRLKSGGGSAWEAIKSGFSEIPSAINWIWGGIESAAKGAWGFISRQFKGAFDGIVNAATEAWNGLSDIWGKIKEGAGEAWDAVQGRAGDVWEGITGSFGEVTDKVEGLFEDLATGIRNKWNSLVSESQSMSIDAISPWQRAESQIVSIWQRIIRAIQNQMQNLERSIASLVSRLVAQINRLLAAAARARAAASGGGGGGSEPAFASGGYVRGPGSGTSDSILARLSNGEFVIRSAAVKHYGPQLLAALNSMRLPKNFPGFNMGGLVSGIRQSMASLGGAGSLPRFATGGMAIAGPNSSPGKSFDLHVGGEVFRGLIAPDDVAAAMQTFAGTRGRASAGRKPGWFK